MEETTILIGKLAAPYLLVTGMGFLLSTKFYEKMVRGSASTDPVTLNLSGAAVAFTAVGVYLGYVSYF